VQNTCKPALIYLQLPSATSSPTLPVVSEWYQRPLLMHRGYFRTSGLSIPSTTPSFVRAAPYSHRIFRVLCLYTCLGEREDADSSCGILAFGCASILRGGTPGANDGPGDAAAVVLPAFVGLAEDLGQPEAHQETDDGPRRIELAAERGEFRRGRAGMVIVVQAFPEGDER
jgi:hypothetical protein